MDWKISLDRYLTTPPYDEFDGWYDDVLENKITDTFFEANENWLTEYSGQCNVWLNKLFSGGKSPAEAAQIIERAFSIFLQQNTH